MSTLASAAEVATTRRLSVGRVIRSEWIKLRSLRSSFVLFFSAVATVITVGLLDAIGLTLAARNGDAPVSQSVLSMPTSGLSFGQLVLGALAALAVTSEYATGMIRTSLAAVPTRLPLLIAKSVVVAALGSVAGVCSAFATYAIGQPILAQQGLSFGLDAPGVVRSLLASGLYLGLIAVLGVGAGALIRHGTGTIVTLIALLFALPTALSMMPGQVAATLLRYLPTEAGSQMLAPTVTAGELTQAAGGAIVTAWALIPFIAALVLLYRRDA